MSVLEARRELEAIPQEPVEAYVSNPNQSNGHERLVLGGVPKNTCGNRYSVVMKDVINDGSLVPTENIASDGNIRCKEEDAKEQPAIAALVINKTAE